MKKFRTEQEAIAAIERDWARGGPFDIKARRVAAANISPAEIEAALERTEALKEEIENELRMVRPSPETIRKQESRFLESENLTSAEIRAFHRARGQAELADNLVDYEQWWSAQVAKVFDFLCDTRDGKVVKGTNRYKREILMQAYNRAGSVRPGNFEVHLENFLREIRGQDREWTVEAENARKGLMERLDEEKDYLPDEERRKRVEALNARLAKHRLLDDDGAIMAALMKKIETTFEPRHRASRQRYAEREARAQTVQDVLAAVRDYRDGIAVRKALEIYNMREYGQTEADIEAWCRQLASAGFLPKNFVGKGAGIRSLIDALRKRLADALLMGDTLPEEAQ